MIVTYLTFSVIPNAILTLPFFILMDQKYFLKGIFFISKVQLSNRLSIISHFDLLDRGYLTSPLRTWGGEYI